MIRVIRFLNGLITFAVVIVLIVSAVYAGYALWDNQQVYDAVENTMDEMRAIRAQMDAPKTQSGLAALIGTRPTATPEPEQALQVTEVPLQAVTVDETLTETNDSVSASESITATASTVSTDAVSVVPAEPSTIPAEVSTEVPAEESTDDSLFGRLKAINPDITAWLTMPGTAIDYPILQGSSNYSYISKNVYGEFALAGSIFLDYRNDEGYQDSYSLVYGHDMSKHRMFSDLNLYKDEAFFKENHLGILLTPEGNHLLQSIACVVTSAGNSSLFNPENWKNYTPEQILIAVQEDAVLVDEDGLDTLKARLETDTPFHVVALSTCSGEFTDARTLLLTLMDP